MKNEEIKILGICLGMQLLGKYSSEQGKTYGLGLMNFNVQKFKKNKNIKIPHVGFNQVKIRNNKNFFLTISQVDQIFILYTLIK